MVPTACASTPVAKPSLSAGLPAACAKRRFFPFPRITDRTYRNTIPESFRQGDDAMERSAQAPMTADQMVAQCNKYTFWSWSAQGAVNPIPMVRAAGIHFWDADGKRYIDMNSQLMCCNIGHGNQRVIDAIKEQAQELAYAGPGMATRIRAEIVPLLARHTPGDLDTFFFTLGGAESNENAIK